MDPGEKPSPESLCGEKPSGEKPLAKFTQIAFHRRTDVGYWSHGRQILPTLGRRWLANQHSG